MKSNAITFKAKTMRFPIPIKRSAEGDDVKIIPTHRLWSESKNKKDLVLFPERINNGIPPWSSKHNVSKSHSCRKSGFQRLPVPVVLLHFRSGIDAGRFNSVLHNDATQQSETDRDIWERLSGGTKAVGFNRFIPEFNGCVVLVLA